MDIKPRLKGFMVMRNREKGLAAAKGTSLKGKNYTHNFLFLQTISKLKEVSLTASMTLEAAIVLPLFIFFFINIMSVLNIIKVQSDLEAALHQTGNEITLLAADIKAGKEVLEDPEEIETSGLICSVGYGVYAATRVKDYLGDSVEKSCVTGGAAGLHFYSSKVMQEGDIVDIVVDYKVHPIFPLIGFAQFPVESRYYGHAWTGYDITKGAGGEDTEEELVYVTEHGTVYHRDMGCKHLKFKISSVPIDKVGEQRSLDGSKYYPCQYCGSVSAGNVFITPYGNRYHKSVSCPGLKRKIYTIPISEVGGRGPCSSCG